MSVKKEHLALGVSFAGIIVLFAACVATVGDSSSSEDVSAVTTPTESPSPPAEPLVYTVTSVTGKRVDGGSCVIAHVNVANNRGTSLAYGKAYSNVPLPFSLVNAKGGNVRSVAKSLTVDWSIAPGDEGTGSVRLCAAGIATGAKVVLHHGTREWKVGIPKPKPKAKPKPKPKRPVKAPRPPSKSSGGSKKGSGGGGGGYPGYTGPRCYAPGGKTWRPC